jgi:hypothetical protein
MTVFPRRPRRYFAIALMAFTGATVACRIAVENVGADTLTTVFIFSSPGFEQVMREISSAEGDPVKPFSPEIRAAAFRRGHAEAGPTDC